MNEDELIRKRFLELANKSYNQNIFTFTEFLSPADIDILFQMKEDLAFLTYNIYGGKAYCDRVIVRFGSEEELGYAEEYPITCIKVEPIASKFADDLSHRDFLGAILNIGIVRPTIGDIIIHNNKGYVFCLTHVAEFIKDNLVRIKHTTVMSNICKEIPADASNILEDKQILIASERLDVLIAGMYNCSRNQSFETIRDRKVYVNSRLNDNPSYTLKKGDVINVRGKGKFIYEGIAYETKKGKIKVNVKLFV